MSLPSPLSGAGLSKLIKKLLECDSTPLQTLTTQAESYLSHHHHGPPESYDELVTLLIQLVENRHRGQDGIVWKDEEKAALVNGHPRIGAPINNDAKKANKGLSEESRKEQLKGGNADEETIQKLALLNHIYEQRYPSLRYVTFVNGRSRSEIAQELENLLSPILDSVPRGLKVDPETPDLNDQDFKLSPRLVVEFGSEKWREELNRALDALWNIAMDRGKKMS